MPYLDLKRKKKKEVLQVKIEANLVFRAITEANEANSPWQII